MRLLVRNQVEHEKRNAISTRTHVLSSIPQNEFTPYRKGCAEQLYTGGNCIQVEF